MQADFRRIIEDRRAGRRHSMADLTTIALGAARAEIPDYQLSSWLMAAIFKPLSKAETVDLTVAMAQSGDRLSLESLPGPVLDKHSTGGVGDKTSIALLPILAACGISVVKMSGSGLGITGGTVDKLHSIPGLRVQLTAEQLLDQVRRVRIGITGQSADLAPADKVLYSLRDATATVDSIPLIVSSILSKKLAGGAKTILIDVKCGSGAFMRTLGDAQELAAWLTEIGGLCGLKVCTSITDMSQPLGAAVGNALEVKEALHVLRSPDRLSASSQRFLSLCLRFATDALTLFGLGGEGEVRAAVYEGRAAHAAQLWLNDQGAPGDLDVIVASLPQAPIVQEVTAEISGWIAAIDAEVAGRTVIELGGGRLSKEDQIDASVGVEFPGPVGSEVKSGDRLFTIHARNREDAKSAEAQLKAGIKVSADRIPARPLFLD